MTLTKEEQEAVAALKATKNFEKGYVLISEGQYFKESYYVFTGLVRQFRLIDGQEVTDAFYSEEEAVFSSSSVHKDKPSPFTLICMEDCMISVVSFEKEKDMYRQFPRFEKMCRITTEKQLLDYQEKFSKFISSTPEERYLNLLKERPGLIDRVPQYHLSSYLGVKPESLSRIRKRLANK